MHTKRRDFLKLAGLSSAAVIADSFLGAQTAKAGLLYSPAISQK